MAVLRWLTENQEDGRQHYAACYAGHVERANSLHAAGFDVDGMCMSHWAAQPVLATDDALLAQGWARFGVAWVCPVHATESQ